MTGRFLLDTNIIIALLKNDASIHDNLSNAREVFIPVVSLGELYFGARKSGRVEENLSTIDAFAAKNVILDCNTQTARLYGEIKNNLHEKGRPLPENDIWIAALARQHNLTLVTRDVHFEDVETLTCEKW